jgi:hypothetical protein
MMAFAHRAQALRVEPGEGADSFVVKGRGTLHLGILIENMRREGYEFQVGPPKVRDIAPRPSGPRHFLLDCRDAQLSEQPTEARLSNRCWTHLAFGFAWRQLFLAQ